MYGQNYGYTNYAYGGATPNMRNRLEAMQQQYSIPQSNYGATSNMVIGRVVTGLEEARAAQIPLDGTPVYFPSPAENKIYIKYVGMNGAPVFNVYELATESKQPVYAENAAVLALQQRVEQLERMLKGGNANESVSNAADVAKQ